MGNLRVVAILAAFLGMCSPMPSSAMGSAFTYQGELSYGGAAADGIFDFEFALYSAATDGVEIATSSPQDVPVSRGLFSVELDYTDLPFVEATPYWIEVRVRQGSETGAYQPLLPRQRITPAPYALTAASVKPHGVDGTAIAPLAVNATHISEGTISADKLAFAPGTVSEVVPGVGLVGGGAGASVSLAADLAVVQARVSGSCSAGSYVQAVAADGTVSCAADPIAASQIPAGSVTPDHLDFTPGDVTGVTAATGLSGGGTAGELNLAVDFSVVQAKLQSACPARHYLRSIAADGSPVCATALELLDRPLLSIASSDWRRSWSAVNVAVPPDGLPVIAFIGNSQTWVAKCSDPMCATRPAMHPIGFSGDVYKLRMAIASDGLPLLVVGTSWNGQIIKCHDEICASRSAPRSLFMGGSHSFDIVVPADGLPVLASTNGSPLIYKCSTFDCSSGTSVHATSSAGLSDVRITATADGLPVIVDTSNNKVRITYCSMADCSDAPTPIEVDGSDMRVADVAALPDGRAAIAYTTTSGLRLARCTGGTCSIGGIENGDGHSPAVAVGPDGLPIVAYASPYGARIAPLVDETWYRWNTTDLQMPEAAAAEIAIGADGKPIAVFGDVSGFLRVAKCASARCD